MNPAKKLAQVGQSLWYDYIRRGLLTSGELQRLMHEDAIVGVTSNPTIFQRAISSSTDYDAALETYVEQNRSAQEILELLTTEDIRTAADILAPVYEASSRKDGYVSVEVSPKLAYDTDGTIEQARQLWDRIARPNVMIKVPGTPAGVPAVRTLLAQGINVNVTLLFSLGQYEAVLQAYLAALEERHQRGKAIDKVASVASFFVSRVDTMVDKKLAAAGGPEALRHRVAIANAKLAYARFSAVAGSPRWQSLSQAGAMPQRLLWASTSAKNPNLPDTYYVEELIGPETVNTVPDQTLRAFVDHGTVRNSLAEDLPGAQELVGDLRQRGVDLEEVGKILQEQGVGIFEESFVDLSRCIASRRQALLQRTSRRLRSALGPLADPVRERIEALEEANVPHRLWFKEASLWSADEAVQGSIKRRLGWLDSVGGMQDAASELRAFAEDAIRDGFQTAILCGMGGSSLCPDVLATIFGPAQGALELRVLDSTVPAAVAQVESGIDPDKTLVLVCSKSGTTAEVNSFYRHFSRKLPASQFVAITDPGTPLEMMAREKGFRKTFLNPADIGGRYSALSYFGLVPAALLGIDLDRLLLEAERMHEASAACVPVAQSPGIWLGAVIGEAARRGRDKLTLVMSPKLAPFGAWLEQLIAESTGKEGKGVLPVDSEPPLDVNGYGPDRLFVSLQLDGDEGEDRLEARLAQLQDVGQPVIVLRLHDIHELGGEFLRWEIATAVASMVIGVNAFDEPNVTESKRNTAALLEEFERSGVLPPEAPTMESRGVTLFGGARGETIGKALAAFLGEVVAGDYVALQAYLPASSEVHEPLQRIRKLVGGACAVATTLGYGPRYLHSTGQLHKGGPPRGLFLQFTCEYGRDLEIPGERYGFATLVGAQAAGDLNALRAKGLRVVRIDVGGAPASALEGIADELELALRG